MSWSFLIGRLFGTEIRIHATFFLLLLWIAIAAAQEGGVASAVENVVFILALFACVVAHEFGHILMARRYGIKTPDVTLLPIGGMARLEKIPERPWQEIAVSVAGPAVNVVIWLVITIILGAQATLGGLEDIADPTIGFLARLAAVNIFLVVFNLIPAFPMDGGRVFRAALALRVGRVRATRIAAGSGQIFAFLFGLFGLISGNPMLLLIAVFVFIAATSENSDVSMRAIAKTMKARDAMITRFETLAENDPLQTAADALIGTTQHEFPVRDQSGHIVGFLDRQAIFAAVTKDDAQGRVTDHMTKGIPSVDENAPLQTALDHLFQSGTLAVAVNDETGAMQGYITRENIGELMVVAGQAEA